MPLVREVDVEEFERLVRITLSVIDDSIAIMREAETRLGAVLEAAEPYQKSA